MFVFSANRLEHISPASVSQVLLDFKQLLDEVFLTSRVIKVVVMTKTESHISEDLGRDIPNAKSVKKILILVLRLFTPMLVTAVCVLFLMRASQGGVRVPLFPMKIYNNIVPLFLKNKLRCSPKFTFTEFPCSQKFRSMFP